MMPDLVVHDLGCSEPCTCGAWDRAVKGKDEAEEWVDGKPVARPRYGAWLPGVEI